MSNEYEQRKSNMQYGELYFWTAPINNWKQLLAAEEMKMEVIQSLQWLKAKELVSIYAYVMMPCPYSPGLGNPTAQRQGGATPIFFKIYRAPV